MSKDVACDGTVGPKEDGTPNIGHTLTGNISRPSHKAPVCDHCGRCCLTRAELRKHLVAHSTSRPWRCEHCAKSFKRKASLRRHVRTHVRLKTWRCEYCGKSFNSKVVREEHILTHNVTALWSCQTCGKTFARKSNMREHELTHNRCWVCKRCDRAFERRHDLKRHKVAHKVAETFECRYCHELFDKKGHRTEHLASHSGVKTVFRCEQCGESFSSRSKLDIHLARHDPTKPFSCSVCGRKLDNVKEKNQREGKQQTRELLKILSISNLNATSDWQYLGCLGSPSIVKFELKRFQFSTEICAFS
uniref:C2H2-type domain-containing protein n=1 Tax=Timema cristinae TaxID=61476 RepID=A0A7R9GRY3_TIMCR|nr:unnamed protein product [Timema cristinae]